MQKNMISSHPTVDVATVLRKGPINMAIPADTESIANPVARRFFGSILTIITGMDDPIIAAPTPWMNLNMIINGREWTIAVRTDDTTNSVIPVRICSLNLPPSAVLTNRMKSPTIAMVYELTIHEQSTSLMPMAMDMSTRDTETILTSKESRNVARKIIIRRVSCPFLSCIASYTPMIRTFGMSECYLT